MDSAESTAALLERARNAIDRARALSDAFAVRARGSSGNAPESRGEGSAVPPELVERRNSHGSTSPSPSSSPRRVPSRGPDSPLLHEEEGLETSGWVAGRPSSPLPPLPNALAPASQPAPCTAPPDLVTAADLASTAAAVAQSAVSNSQTAELIAQRLRLLQLQQQSTYSTLLHLRLEQLGLRQQQLSALQTLIRSELEGPDPLPQEVRDSFGRLERLIGVVLGDIRIAVGSLEEFTGPEASTPISGTLLRELADRDDLAEQVSKLARASLAVHRMLRDDSGGATGGDGNSASTRDALSPDQLKSLPLLSVIFVEEGTEEEAGVGSGDGIPLTAVTAVGGVGQGAAAGESLPEYLSPHEAMEAVPTTCEANETCALCLTNYAVGHFLRKLPTCGHRFHCICVDKWLQLKGSCPLCREKVTV